MRLTGAGNFKMCSSGDGLIITAILCPKIYRTDYRTKKHGEGESCSKMSIYSL